MARLAVVKELFSSIPVVPNRGIVAKKEPKIKPNYFRSSRRAWIWVVRSTPMICLALALMTT